MKVLILGSGGREHALAWKIQQSAFVSQIFVAPGNAGTAIENKTQNINLSIDDPVGLLHFARQEHIDLTIVGPEAPLAQGLVDLFSAHQQKCFGPSQQAALLESSKAYSKHFMQRHRIPTAHFATFTDSQTAIAYCQNQSFPLVIKASGLAAGKGVIIAHDLSQAKQTVIDMLEQQRFGAAGHEIVIEECLYGEEVSFMILTDGCDFLTFETSQDHKARDEGDQGPNTGGMGAYSPAPMVSQQLHQQIIDQVIKPTLLGLQKDQIPYRGFLYAGLMITPDNHINVLEYNCRLGDPETQVLMMRLQSDLLSACLACFTGNLPHTDWQWDPRPALTTVLASRHYPGSYPSGEIISGLTQTLSPDQKIFHSGTKQAGDHILTNGGRVLSVTARGDNLQAAKAQIENLIGRIHWDSLFYRRDIGHRAL